MTIITRSKSSDNNNWRKGGNEKNNVESDNSINDGDKKHQVLLSFWDFFDPSKPWVLVKNGSAGGRFDFVPIHFRVGPWSVQAVAYLSAIFYLTLLTGCFFASDMGTPYYWQHDHPGSSGPFSQLRYPAPRSLECWYNVATGAWMAFVMILVGRGPLGRNAWATYTVQSWTLLCVRHFVVALACYDPRWIPLAEILRFPALCSSTVTFVVWNFVVAPLIYKVALRTREAKLGFLKFNFSFRLVQIHGFNIVFAYLNGVWSGPLRKLYPIDLYLAVLSVALYMAFYFLVLDRIGVHLYFVFSPRTEGLLVASWTAVLIIYVCTFVLWGFVLGPNDDYTP